MSSDVIHPERPRLVCARCGGEVLLGEPMYWTPESAGLLWHDTCAQAIGLLPSAPPPKPTRRRRGERVSQV